MRLRSTSWNQWSSESQFRRDFRHIRHCLRWRARKVRGQRKEKFDYKGGGSFCSSLLQRRPRAGQRQWIGLSDDHAVGGRHECLAPLHRSFLCFDRRFGAFDGRRQSLKDEIARALREHLQKSGRVGAHCPYASERARRRTDVTRLAVQRAVHRSRPPSRTISNAVACRNSVRSGPARQSLRSMGTKVKVRRSAGRSDRRVDSSFRVTSTQGK
jgi:hypothetical protein